MLIRHVGVVSESDSVPLPQLARAAAAVQKQVTRDFAPIWNVRATVAAFGALEPEGSSHVRFSRSRTRR